MLHECIPVQVDYKKANAEQDGYQPLLYTYVLDGSDSMPLMRERPAVIICPGGGYTFKSPREAEPIAMRFLAAGVHAFVLQYSVAPSRYPSAMLELAAAVKLVREKAGEWGIKPQCVYIAGFSAGGHLCASLGTLWKEPLLQESLGGDAALWRPDGMILCYPVITFGPYGHQGSKNSLLGDSASPEAAQALSLENRVDADTVPAFLWHTYEDGAVPVENALLFSAALRRVGVPFELHIYEKGCHGLSLCDETTAQSDAHLKPDDAGWMALAVRWVKRHAG